MKQIYSSFSIFVLGVVTIALHGWLHVQFFWAPDILLGALVALLWYNKWQSALMYYGAAVWLYSLIPYFVYEAAALALVFAALYLLRKLYSPEKWLYVSLSSFTAVVLHYALVAPEALLSEWSILLFNVFGVVLYASFATWYLEYVK